MISIWSLSKIFNTSEIAGAINKQFTQKWQNLSKLFVVRPDHGPIDHELRVSKLNKIFS